MISARKPAYFRRSSTPIISTTTARLTSTESSWVDPGIARLEDSLHDLLETALQCYVNSWYPITSPRDKTFLPHVYHLLVRVLSSIAINIEAASDSGGLDELILVNIPELIAKHLETWKRANSDVLDARYNNESEREPLEGAIAARYALLDGHSAVQRIYLHEIETSPVVKVSNFETDIARLPSDVNRSLGEAMSSSLHGDDPFFHQHLLPSLDPAPAAIYRIPIPSGSSQALRPTPSYRVSEAYLSTLAERLLRHHLPSTDYASATERTIITEILASAILSNVLRKLSQGWMLNRLALSLLGDPRRRHPNDQPSNTNAIHQPGSMGIQALLFEAYRTVILIIYQFASVLLFLSNWYTSLHGHWKSVIASNPLPEGNEKIHTTRPDHWKAGVENAMEPSLAMFGAFLDLVSGPGPSRCSLTEIRAWIGMGCGPVALGRFADKLLPLYMHNHLYKPSVLARLTTTLQEVLFPNGEIAPSVPDATESEAQDLVDRLIARLLEVFPIQVRRVIIGSDTQAHEEAIRRLIAPFQNSDVNLHLLVRLLETILLTIEPKLANDPNDM